MASSKKNKIDKRKLVIQVVCIVLVALMILSAVAAAFLY